MPQVFTITITDDAVAARVVTAVCAMDHYPNDGTKQADFVVSVLQEILTQKLMDYEKGIAAVAVDVAAAKAKADLTFSK